MTADYSRWPQRGGRDFAAVLLQQGRVLTDADWNEAVLVADRRERLETIDGLGRAVVPVETPDAFRISAGGAGDLAVGLGRAYLDGMLVENHGPSLGPFDAITAEPDPFGNVSYLHQPWLPNPPALPAGPYLAYLKSLRRERSFVDDDSLLEPALGVDTAVRTETIWQVRAIAAPANVTCSTPLSSIPGFSDVEPAAAGRLTTDTAVVAGPPDPCRTAPPGGYTGLENQLYRIEIHRGGVVGGAAGATFKWSRDNGIVVARVLAINPARTQITVDRIGRDSVLSIHDGDWVEITDDEHELNGEPGELRRVHIGGGVDEAARTILLDAALPAAPTFPPVDAAGNMEPARNTRIRRWDQAGKVYSAAGAVLTDLDVAASGDIRVPGAAVSVVLEHGIIASFSVESACGRFRTGDHWVFAARTATAEVEKLDNAPPRGIHAHYAALAVVAPGAAPTDCRIVVPPLGDIDQLEYVAGDGQEVMPSYLQPAVNVLLPVAPTVGVSRGPIVVAGRSVRWTLLDAAQSGVIDGAGDIDTLTGADGQTSVSWALKPGLPVQRLQAQLLGGDGLPTGLPVIFAARLSTADQIAFDPRNCGPGTAETVQAAIDELCRRQPEAGCCTTVHPGDDLLEAIKQAADEHKGHVCLCLEPGTHEFRESEIRGLASLTVHGRGAILALDVPLTLREIEAVSLTEISIVDGTSEDGAKFGALLTVDDCQLIDIDGISAELRVGDESSTVLRLGYSGDIKESRPVIRLRNAAIANRTDAAKPVVLGLEAIPATTMQLVDLAERRLAPAQAKIEADAILNQPTLVREADASTTERLAIEREADIGTPAADVMNRISTFVRTGEAISAPKLTSLLAGARQLGSQIRRGPSEARTALVIADATSETWIEDNVFEGKVVVYGDVAKLDLEQGIELRLTDAPWNNIKGVPATAGRLRVSRNTLARIAVDADIVGAIGDLVSKGQTEKKIVLFDSMLLDGNSMSLPVQSLTARTIEMTSNTLARADRLGWAFADAATVIGNIADGGQFVVAARDKAAVGNLRMGI